MAEKNLDEIIAEIMARVNGAEHTTTFSAAPLYKCAACQDTGWVQVFKGERSFSRECECVKARNAERLMRQSGLAGSLDKQTFDSFQTDTPQQTALKQTAKRYLDDLLSMPSDAPRKPWLYISGNPGCGKTHICTAVCGELLKANVEVVYMEWVHEVRRLKAFINEPDFDNLVEKYMECEILYIDDLFKQTYRETPLLSDADTKMAFTVLDYRYSRNKPTIISSEWSLDILMEADEGVFSRVYDKCKSHICHVRRDKKNNFRLKPAVSAQDYEQRHYTEEELNSVGVDLMEEARRLRGAS